MLFRADILNPYREDPRIVSALRGVLLLNLDEFLNWFYPTALSSIQRPDISSLVTDSVTKINRSKREMAKDVLRQLPQLVCLNPETNKPKIGEEYGIMSIDKLLSRDAMFDVIFAINRSDGEKLNEKLNMIVGFMITQAGECFTKPYVHGIKLICATPAVKSILLIGSYLYCIKNSLPQVEQEGLLELAGGYVNMPGFISYSRMGFNKDPSLAECSAVLSSLPMSVDITTLSNQIIIQRATGQDIRVHTSDDSGLYNIKSVKTLRPSEINNLITCNNLIYKIQMLTYPIFMKLIIKKKLSFFESLMLGNVPTDADTEQYLINLRSILLVKAYPQCKKKGVCDIIMGWFGTGTRRNKGKKVKITKRNKGKKSK
jgi:hypothetical protein